MTYNYYDFTQPGGFPFTQDVLGRMQESYGAALDALAAIGGDGPYVIAGVNLAITSGFGGTFNYTIVSGWMYYNGRLIKIDPGVVTAVNLATQIVVLEQHILSTTLMFNDGSTPSVVKTEVWRIATRAIAAVLDPAIEFDMATMRPFGRERDWTNITVTSVSVGNVSGNIYYKKNTLTNTLLIRGTLVASSFSSFAGGDSPLYYTMATLPSDYRPLNAAHFVAPVTDATLVSSTTLSSGDILQLNCRVLTDGSIDVRWLKSTTLAASYQIEFTALLPLE